MSSDRRSFAELATRFPLGLAGTFFLGMAEGEGVALDKLRGFCDWLGMTDEELRAYEPHPGAQAYPAFVAWLALNGSRADVVLAFLANLAVWGVRRSLRADRIVCASFLRSLAGNPVRSCLRQWVLPMCANWIDYAAPSAGAGFGGAAPTGGLELGKQPSVDRQYHPRRMIELRVGDAAGEETDSGIETHGMRVGGHFQSLDTTRSDDLGDAID